MAKKNITKEEKIFKPKTVTEFVSGAEYLERQEVLSTTLEDSSLFLDKKDDNIKTMKISKIIIAFVTGVILTVFVYQAFTIYKLRSVVTDDHTTLTQVVNFLNTQIQATQPQPTPVKSSAATSDSPPSKK